MTAALEGGEWSAARPGRTLPPGKTRCLFYRTTDRMDAQIPGAKSLERLNFVTCRPRLVTFLCKTCFVSPSRCRDFRCASQIFEKFCLPLFKINDKNAFVSERSWSVYFILTLNPLKWKTWWAPNNASKWQMGFNSTFKGLIVSGFYFAVNQHVTTEFSSQMRNRCGQGLYPNLL